MHIPKCWSDFITHANPNVAFQFSFRLLKLRENCLLKPSLAIRQAPSGAFGLLNLRSFCFIFSVYLFSQALIEMILVARHNPHPIQLGQFGNCIL